MGLKFPDDLEAWSQWQGNAHLLRRAKNTALSALGRGKEGKAEDGSSLVRGYLHTLGEGAQVLFALDSTSPTSLNSLVKPAFFLGQVPYAVWAPQDVTSHLPAGNWTVQEMAEGELASHLSSLQQVLALGHYMAWGASSYRLAQALGARFITVQHGLHTPYAPPLAEGTHLLAFSQADADFWISGRKDVTSQVVGSQLFWEAAQEPRLALGDKQNNQPVFLGQMHGAELPRASFALAGYSFCKAEGARYRPHPSERDKLSLLTHRLWEKMGIEIDKGGQPLKEVTSPVVSIFSTGVLEAALRGVPSWVYHPRPTDWLEEFWDRYGLSPWGGDPTPAPPIPDLEPAQKIASLITQSLEN